MGAIRAARFEIKRQKSFLIQCMNRNRNQHFACGDFDQIYHGALRGGGSLVSIPCSIGHVTLRLAVYWRFARDVISICQGILAN
jgi:hypothetical protein